MEGAFVGNVTLVDGKEKFMHSYEDKNIKSLTIFQLLIIQLH